MSLTFEVVSVLLDIGILFFVAMEYFESKELNNKLNKVYKKKHKKVNADQLVKAIVAQEVSQ